jgi:hypothetical protein
MRGKLSSRFRWCGRALLAFLERGHSLVYADAVRPSCGEADLYSVSARQNTTASPDPDPRRSLL